MASVLQITPHRVFPPRGGRRAFFFLREIAREHQVVAIFPQTLDSLQGTREGYTFPAKVELLSPLETPPPCTAFDWLPSKIGRALKYRWLRRSLEGPAYSTLLEDYHLIAAALQKKQIDIVIFDHIETMASCAPLVRRLAPKAVLALNAHNVDSELYAQQLKDVGGQNNHKTLANAYQTARRLETHLADYVDFFWACSEMDRDRLDRMNRSRIPGFFVPNGIAPELLPFDANPNKRLSKRLLFCGALNYAPNIRGLEWFHHAIWPLIRAKDPEIRLVVIGYGAGARDFATVRDDPGVDFVGEVDTVIQHYHQTSVAVVPLLEGSGTRVKILEAMSLGSPVVSTTIGAEGIPAESGTHVALADDPAAFAEATLRLLNDETFYLNLRRAARQLIEERFDWRRLGEEINRIISEVAARPATLEGELPRDNGSVQTELGTRLDAMNPVLSQIVRTGYMINPDGTPHLVHSNIAPEEVLFLADVVREAKPRVSLEIGLAYGTSALTILDSVDRGTYEKHICIDPYQNRQPDWGGRGLYNLERAGFSPFVEFHEAPSYEALPRLLAQRQTVDFAFVDGWHTFDYVMVDFFFIDKLLRPGGTVVLDDADSPPIRKFLRYVLTNLDYSIIPGFSRPPSLKRNVYNAVGSTLNRLGEAASLQRMVRGLFRPEFLNSNERLGLSSGCVALRKERNDRRHWEHHAEF